MTCEVCKKQFHVKVRPNMNSLCSLDCHAKLSKLLDETLTLMKAYAKKNPEAFLSDDDESSENLN